MQSKRIGYFLFITLFSAGLLVNCGSQPATNQSAPRREAPPPPAPSQPVEISSPETPSLRPLTKRILDRAYNRDHLDAKRFQYFLSETMGMERDLSASILNYNAKGELFQEDSLTQERIVFERETKGVAVDVKIGEDYKRWELEVRFDPASANKTLTFRENDDGTSFELVYVETSAGRKIPYGENEYLLKFEAVPCLLIRMAETSKNLPLVTTVPGLAVDSPEVPLSD
ncbi:MAG: hypothetical protein LBT39_07140 [Treponema sp.]|jgi:hypothetical protein|nr:hypothetical protein [Treponema sp.]